MQHPAEAVCFTRLVSTNPDRAVKGQRKQEPVLQCGFSKLLIGAEGSGLHHTGKGGI